MRLGGGLGVVLGLGLSLALGRVATAQETTMASSSLLLHAEQAYLQERNPLRLPADAQSLPPATGGDSAWTSSVGGRLGAAWGRQRLAAFGQWADTRYERQGALDQVAYQAGLILDLEAAAEFGARLQGLRRRDPLEGQARLDPVTGTRRLQDLTQVGGTAQWGLQRRWTLELQAQTERMEPNRAQVGWTGYEQTIWRAQGRWRGGDGLGRGSEWVIGRRWIEGTQFAAPASVVEQPAQAYAQDLWEAQWTLRTRPGDRLNLRAASGQGRREWMGSAGPVAPMRTGQAVRSLGAELRWQPRSAWSVQAQVARDEGQQTQGTFTVIEGTGLALQGASDVRQARVQLQWEPSRRVQTFISAQRLDRLGRQSWGLGDVPVDLRVDERVLQALSTTQWRDRLDRYAWGAVWALDRRVSLRCSALREAKWGLAVFAAAPPPSAAGSLPLQWRDTGWQCSIRWQAEAINPLGSRHAVE